MNWQKAKPFMPAFVLLMACTTEAIFTPTGVSEGYISTTHEGGMSAEALSHAAGEFRIVAANILWLKVVDHYHHQWMASGGDWSKDQAILPYLRMITWLDPHFIEAYDVGGLVMVEVNRYNDAEKWLKEGASKNETDPLLYYDLAMLHAWYGHDAKGALPYAIEARDKATDPFDHHKYALLCHSLERDIAQGGSITADG